MLAALPIYNSTSSTSETRILNLDQTEQIKPHDPVSVESVDTACVQVVFASGGTEIVLLDMATMRDRLFILFGVVDASATLT